VTQPVLFVSADLPWPPDGGGRIATLRVLEAIAADRPVDLIALSDTPDADLTRLHQICRQVSVVAHPFTFGRHPVRQSATAIVAAVRRRAYRIEKFRSGAMAAMLRDAKRAERYALIHHDQFGVAIYRDPAYPSTLTTQNVESDIYRRGTASANGIIRKAWAAREASALHRAEPGAYGGFDHVFVLSEHDARLLTSIGVDRVSRLPIPMPVVATVGEPPRRPVILSLGSMSWFGVEDGLLWFHREVWPRIRAAVPDVEWRMVGPNAGPAIRRLAATPGISLVGYVEDAQREILGARVAIVPLHVAGGIRIKLLQLLGMGRPSVSTSVGAMGLDAADGEGCYIRDDAPGFADAVIRLLVDDVLWEDVARRGRTHIERGHSEAAMRDAVQAGLTDAISHHARV
jgi:glycosyltransferase involved in cell wall biosynthesis